MTMTDTVPADPKPATEHHAAPTPATGAQLARDGA